MATLFLTILVILPQFQTNIFQPPTEHISKAEKG